MGSSSNADDLFGDPFASAGMPASDPFAASYGGGATTDAFDPFGGSPRTSAPLTLVRPPIGWLIGALVTGIAGLALALVLRETLPAAFVAWALGGPITIVLTAMFEWRDTIARTHLGYATRSVPLTRTLYVCAIGIGLAAVVLAALTIADWAARL